MWEPGSLAGGWMFSCSRCYMQRLLGPLLPCECEKRTAPGQIHHPLQSVCADVGVGVSNCDFYKKIKNFKL